MSAIMANRIQSKASFEEARDELNAQIAAGELDVGQDDCDDRPSLVEYDQVVEWHLKKMKNGGYGADSRVGTGSCIYELAKKVGVSIPADTHKVRYLDGAVLAKLRAIGGNKFVAWKVFPTDPESNHVGMIVDDELAKFGTFAATTNGWDGPLEWRGGIARFSDFFWIGTGREYDDVFFYKTGDTVVEDDANSNQNVAVLADDGSCLYTLIKLAGLDVNKDINSVDELSAEQLLRLRSVSGAFKVGYIHYSPYDKRNHVWPVHHSAQSGSLAYTMMDSAGGLGDGVVTGILSLEEFFNVSSANVLAHKKFFASPAVNIPGRRTTSATEEDEGGDDDGDFGADVPLPPNVAGSGYPGQHRSTGSADAGGFSTASQGLPPAARFGAYRDTDQRSVVDEQPGYGGSNVTGVVVRPKKRVIGSRAVPRVGGVVKKKYAPSTELMFNNLDELYQDSMSRDAAQDVLEQVFNVWGIPFEDSKAVKYAEDLIFAFVIATTASNKADYNAEFEVPCARVDGGTIVVNMQVLSDVVTISNGRTRRQFAKGIANDMYSYLKHPENIELLPKLAERAGCDPQFAALAFDGSTNCSSMTSSQLKFTKLLENRNLFEDDALLAQGASDRLMSGMHSGVRSKIER